MHVSVLNAAGVGFMGFMLIQCCKQMSYNVYKVNLLECGTKAELVTMLRKYSVDIADLSLDRKQISSDKFHVVKWRRKDFDIYLDKKNPILEAIISGMDIEIPIPTQAETREETPDS
jgi:hypothetical protein